MTDIIHLLPDSVANQIAAGEVIQRPASCLKELVENSLDAGAKHIRIIVRDAGRTLLQVVDDGKGMSPTDARMAFERHATSKIAQASDLFHLRTMGFRGEALASICAVAQVEMQTRRPEDEVGTYLEIAGSDVLKQEMVQCPAGTNMRVKNLFYNVPARRKFLKTDQTELRNLLAEYHRIVLVNPDVQFTFVSNDEILSELPTGTTKQRIEAVFGHTSKPFTGQLVDVATRTELVNICGFVGKPEAAGKNSQQYMFVNGRYMRHPYFHKAVMTAYAGMLQPDHTPSYFLYFDIHPDAIDVNIHPTKTEIKFSDEQPVWQILQAAVRESLGKFNLVPSLDFNREGDIDIPPLSPDKRVITPPVVNVNADYNPFMRSHDVSYGGPVKNWERIYAPLQQRQEQLSLLNEEQDKALGKPSVAYQYKENYLLCPVEEGLVLIDKQRAYAAVFYDMVLRQIHNKQGMKQQVLFPEILDFSSEDTQTLLEIQQQLDAVGFEITRVGPDSFAVNAVPASLDASLASRSLVNILQAVGTLTATAQEQWEQTIASSLAKDMAANCGKLLTDNEVQSLLGKLFALSDHTYTPDGKKIMCLIPDADLCKQLQ
ncbi:MAG TPA: DNA mismatch repair endonuclease MutL [Bacteroidales bacterium]|nr:DNA mismatch repair endonuclease MutL [Bacteroidales bacterium]